MQSAIFSGHRH